VLYAARSTVAAEQRRLAAIAARAGQYSHLLVLLPIEWPEQEPYRTCYRD